MPACKKKIRLQKKSRNIVLIHIPEDSAYSTPGRIELFYFFLGVYVRDTFCNSVFFFPTISGPFSHNLDRDLGPKSRFFEFFSVFFWLFSTEIICQNIIKKSILSFFCELLFHLKTFLGVHFIESLINGEQKLDLRKFFWKNSKYSVIGLY
jgi:hypothetical protein